MNIYAFSCRVIVIASSRRDSASTADGVFLATSNALGKSQSNQLRINETKSVIQDLEAQARSREWSLVAQSALDGRTDSQRLHLLPQWLRELANTEPEFAKTALEKAESDPATVEEMNADRSLSSLIRTLVEKIRNIIGRKTIICLTQESGNETLSQVAVRMAEEVYARLLRDELNWSFVQLAKNESDLKEKGKSKAPMAVFLERLQMKVAGAPLSSLAPKKPGPILMVGETGTGKTMAARLFSTLSERPNFKPINISAVSKDLLEARLRGSKKGSYTGSASDEPSWFEHADKGILFLDELQSAGMAFQTQLLDLLDPTTNEVTVARVGEDTNFRQFDVKVILAINEQIAPLISKELLRKDIFYRIRDIVRLPPLRERLAVDTNGQLLRVLLSLYHWKSSAQIEWSTLSNMSMAYQSSRFPRFTPSALEQLRHHSWPGNLREFERVANDLYWDIDQSVPKEPYPKEWHIDYDAVECSIKLFDMHLPSKELESLPLRANDIEARKLQDVQTVLREVDFVLSRAIKKLGGLKLGAHQSLKSYLRENRTLLDKDVLADSRIRTILA